MAQQLGTATVHCLPHWTLQLPSRALRIMQYPSRSRWGSLGDPTAAQPGIQNHAVLFQMPEGASKGSLGAPLGHRTGDYR